MGCLCTQFRRLRLVQALIARYLGNLLYYRSRTQPRRFVAGFACFRGVGVMAEKETLMSGSDILIECLIRHGVEVVFAYPGGASMPIHQSLTKVEGKLRTILPRH